MTITNALLSVGIGYILGSIPFAVIIAAAKGVDILKYGSGNPGATNVKRACGTFAGRLCFFLDALKGFLAAGWVFILGFFGVNIASSTELTYMSFLGLIGAIIGHTFSVFLKFKGGKGVSVTIGGLCAVLTYPILIGLIVWVVSFFATRMVSFASILMAASLPISCIFYFGFNSFQFWFALVLGLFVIYRHKSNIKRILSGTEYKFKNK